MAPTMNKPSAMSIIFFRPSRSAKTPDIGETKRANKLVQAFFFVNSCSEERKMSSSYISESSRLSRNDSSVDIQVIRDLSRVVSGLEDRSLPMETRVADITPVSSKFEELALHLRFSCQKDKEKII